MWFLANMFSKKHKNKLRAMRPAKLVSLLLSCVAFSSLLGLCHGGGFLQLNFYKDTCPRAEEIVKTIIWKHVSCNVTLPANFLRMHFHDCFVRGCDGSVLIDPMPGNLPPEKEATPNLFLSGFDVINEVKDELEKVCPGVVSCADIIALAARDAVSFQYKKSLWKVLTGRRDGTISLESEVQSNIPMPSFTFSSLVQSFSSKGLSVKDLVVLSGAHTIGVGHCNSFSNRLYNFTGKGDQDPSLNPDYAAFLKAKCPKLSDNTTTVEMDPMSALSFDPHYYVNLKDKQGLFQSDAALLTNGVARRIASELIEEEAFFSAFNESIQNMGSIGVLTGIEGQIRQKCNMVNI